MMPASNRAEDMIMSSEHSEAYRNGWLAHKNHNGVEDKNPYDSATQRYSTAQWIEGWCARFAAVKHDLDLSLDSEDL